MEPFCRQGKDQYHGEPPTHIVLECDALFIKLHRSNFCCIFPLSDSSSINREQAIGAKLVQRRSVTSRLCADRSQHGPAGPISLTTNYPCLQLVFHAANLTLLLPAGRTLHSQTAIPHGRSRAIYGQILSGDRPLYLSLMWSPFLGGPSIHMAYGSTP